jgi:membrane protein required for colicin V production
MDINWLDIILLSSMLISGLLALTQGFIKETLSLIGWIISFISVTILMPEAGKFLKPFIDSESLSDLITIALIFIVTLLIWRVISLMIIKLLKITSINYIDRILGFIFGVLRVYILLLIAFAILILPLESTDRPDYIKVSNISPIIEKSVNLTLNNIPQLKYYISRGQETSSEIINPEENGINKNE